MAKKTKIPNQPKRTRNRVNAVNWYTISKVMSIRWYINRLENTLLSIVAEHPDVGDPFRKKSFAGVDADIYTRIWNALATCEAQLIKIKKIHHPPVPLHMKPPPNSGCYCDDDCPSGWHCNQDTWLCEPGNDHGKMDTAQFFA